MMNRKAQVAFEYLVIVGVVVALLIPIWFTMASLNSRASQSLTLSQAQTAVSKLVSAADLVYTQGAPAQVTVKAYIPSGVQSITITNQTVRMRLIIGGDATDVAATSIGNMTGVLSHAEGLYTFTVKAVGNRVNISQ